MPLQTLFQRQIYIASCTSSNDYLKQYFIDIEESNNLFLRTDYQTNGKGQGTNFWESEKAKNLLVSFVLYPHKLKAIKQFDLSKWVAINLLILLSEYLDSSKLWIKWPNDIYYQDKKLAGILIENSIIGDNIYNSIIGVGLNVNQEIFYSEAPNPISIFQILNKHIPLDEISGKFVEKLNSFSIFSSSEYQKQVDKKYLERLYWRGEKHLFRIHDKITEAVILGVDNFGFLKLQIANRVQVFDIKEVVYLS